MGGKGFLSGCLQGFDSGFYCRVLILVSTAGIEDDGRTVGRGMGSYPIMRKNGDWLVME